jgi:glycosyltransferase involved in cell wall biosynthesis
VSCSLANRQWILNNNLAGKDKVVAIPSYNSHLKEILEVPMKSIGEKKIFAFYGRSSRQKGIETLLKAIAIANSPNAEFIVQLLNTTPELEGLIEELNLHKRSNIHFIRGPVNVPALLSNCDVVIIPSRWEPFGQVALEAKAAGKHIIASEVDGLVEQLDNLGVLLPVEDSNALANAIIDTSFADVQYLETKGQEARSQAQEAYKAYVKNWQDALSSV